jgi:hypothetical protein
MRNVIIDHNDEYELINTVVNVYWTNLLHGAEPFFRSW